MDATVQTSFTIGGIFGVATALLARALVRKNNRDSATGSRDQKGFCFSGSHRDDCGVIDKPATGTCRVVGFGVMYSPVGASPRLAEGMQLRRLWIDRNDAPMPWLREAEKLANSNRVGFASPSTIHQEAVMNHTAPEQHKTDPRFAAWVAGSPGPDEADQYQLDALAEAQAVRPDEDEEQLL